MKVETDEKIKIGSTGENWIIFGARPKVRTRAESMGCQGDIGTPRKIKTPSTNRIRSKKHRISVDPDQIKIVDIWKPKSSKGDIAREEGSISQVPNTSMDPDKKNEQPDGSI